MEQKQERQCELEWICTPPTNVDVCGNPRLVEIPLRFSVKTAALASQKTKGQPCQKNHNVIVVGNSEMGKLFSPGTFFSIEANDKHRTQIVIKVDVFIEKEKGVGSYLDFIASSK
ncbi:unnamed protein product [Cylicostephanus goldi]|uniref:Uncharacterized protein n=1 Tax=Cylicostephanus goldi TaxID=71465 RepID=A0A3P6RQ31_CYLGO|nr:unnamed protein product [Cylicostephanus goldi]